MNTKQKKRIGKKPTSEVAVKIEGQRTKREGHPEGLGAQSLTRAWCRKGDV